MKYYIYVSDAKVDMLFSQIPKAFLDRMATELKFDLKIVSVSLKENLSEETRYTKVRLVCEYIENNLSVGTVDEPDGYFKGSLPMRWSVIGSEPKAVVIFSSVSGPTVLALIGSVHHLTGYVRPTTGILFSGSFAFGMEQAFADYLLLKELEKHAERDAPDLVESVESVTREFHNESWRLGRERFEFLARRLIHARGTGLASKDIRHPGGQIIPGIRDYESVLIGTPIYVASAD